ncbi:hypothetical protein CALCODRAFT_190038 [Calocera cornea HHB12733]|uniref:DUF6535 domain-containing protein n=1 Tax=Calocera cornea HHB12733 TaxID=1353952 RepID=A0A165C869_9BASI|nr:hypothetical protein CALCODRAFT_190038 [Calocera cornea HHB12733]
MAYSVNDRVVRVPLQRVMERQMRFEGINDWHVPSIITVLPLAIHVAVFLFLLGLVLFAWPVSIVLFILLTLLLLLGLGLYTTLAVLPLLFPGCPYKSPLVSVLDFFGRHMKNILYRALRTHRKLRKVRRPTLNEYTLGGGGGETDFIKRNGFDLQAKAMVWMASSPNRIVRDHALHILSRYTMLTAQFQKVSSDITRAAENALADYASMTEQRDDIVLPKETMESLCLISTLTTHAYVPRNHLNSWLYPANEVLDKFVGLTKNSRYGNDMGLPRLVAVLSDTCEEKAGECLVLGRGWRRPEISTGTYVEMERALTLIHSSAPDISYLSASLEYWTFLLELKPIPALFL